jgi:hypothetical protein
VSRECVETIFTFKVIVTLTFDFVSSKSFSSDDQLKCETQRLGNK